MRYLVFALAVVLLAASPCSAVDVTLNATLTTPDGTYNTFDTTIDITLYGVTKVGTDNDVLATGTQALELQYTVASGVITPTAIRFLYGPTTYLDPSPIDYDEVSYTLLYPELGGLQVDIFSTDIGGCTATGRQWSGEPPVVVVPPALTVPFVPVSGGSFALDTSTTESSDMLIYVNQGSFTFNAPGAGIVQVWDVALSPAWNDGSSRVMTGTGSVSVGAASIGLTGLATHDVDIQVPTAGASFPIWNPVGPAIGPNPLGELDINGILRMTAQVSYQLGAGDANGDGKVDLLDLGIVGDHWNATGVGWAEGDFSGDTNVDLLDLGVVGDNWNATYSYAEGTAPDAVPEPSTLTLLVLGAVASFLFFRRQRS